MLLHEIPGAFSILSDFSKLFYDCNCAEFFFKFICLFSTRFKHGYIFEVTVLPPAFFNKRKYHFSSSLSEIFGSLCVVCSVYTMVSFGPLI